MKRTVRVALVLACALLPTLAGAWEAVQPGTPARMRKAGWGMQFPEGWLQDTSGAAVLATRDGVLLNSIDLALVPHKKTFPNAKKPSTPTSAPEDIAESLVANLQADKTITDVELVASDPAELAGRPAFRVHVRYRLLETQSGARLEQITVGTPLPEGLLVATYRAPAIHYFAKWLPTFDAALPTVALLPPPDKKKR